MAVISNQGPQARSLRTLKKWISEGKLAAGELLPTEYNLMELLKVSRTTVRAALGQLESEGLIQAGDNRRRIVCEQTSDRPNMMSNTVGLLTLPILVPEHVQQRRVGPVWERFIQVGAVEALQQAGKNALTLQLNDDYQTRLAQLHSERPYGLIVLNDGIRNSPAWDSIRTLSVPMAVYGFAKHFPDHDTLASDHAAGCAALTKFLLKRGRKRILRVWTTEGSGVPIPAWLQERDRGFEQAMHEAGAPILPPLHVPISQPEEFNEDTLILRRRILSGFLMDFLSRPNRVDAILAASDSAFFPIAAACRQFGLKPNEDIDLVGYDNNWHESVYRNWEPAAPLASADKNNLTLGHELADLLVARAEKKLPKKKVHRLIAPEIVVVKP